MLHFKGNGGSDVNCTWNYLSWVILRLLSLHHQITVIVSATRVDVSHKY
jgi:hypothetical protein